MQAIKINDFVKCADCKKAIKREDALLCDGIKHQYRELPCGKWKNALCSRTICKSCATHIAGYDFCKICVKRRERC